MKTIMTTEQAIAELKKSEVWPDEIDLNYWLSQHLEQPISREIVERVAKEVWG